MPSNFSAENKHLFFSAEHVTFSQSGAEHVTFSQSSAEHVTFSQSGIKKLIRFGQSHVEI